MLVRVTVVQSVAGTLLAVCLPISTIVPSFAAGIIKEDMSTGSVASTLPSSWLLSTLSAASSVMFHPPPQAIEVYVICCVHKQHLSCPPVRVIFAVITVTLIVVLVWFHPIMMLLRKEVYKID